MTLLQKLLEDMIQNLRNYENLGSPQYFYLLITFMLGEKDEPWKIQDLNGYFHNKNIDGRYIFSGCIPFAVEIGLLYKQGDYYFVSEIIDKSSISFETLTTTVQKMIIERFSNDDEFQNLIIKDEMKFEIFLDEYLISNNVFLPHYGNIKQLFLDFDIMLNHPDPANRNQYVLKRQILSKLFPKNELESKKTKISVKQLENILRAQKENGEKAEEYIYHYEKNRLNNSKSIEWVSKIITNEGFDIASFDDVRDEKYNRFIEVKSFSGNQPYFYWSKNEIEVANLRKEKYWLYLVCIDKIIDENYSPIMISNPANFIFQNENWKVVSESYKVTFEKH